MLVDRQQIPGWSFEFAVLESPQRICNLLSGAIDHASVNPSGKLIEIGPNFLGGVVLRSEVSDGLIACAFLIEIVITSRHAYHHLLGIAFLTQGYIVVEELPPGSPEHC